jgi:AcrR family transcriptional regulator
MSTDVSSEPRLPSRREQAAERRRQLVEVASRLIEEGGVESLTLPGTSERAGCARTLVYRYFASREDLLMAVLESYFERLDGWLSEPEQRRAVARLVEASDPLDPGSIRSLVALCWDALAAAGLGGAILRATPLLTPRLLALVGESRRRLERRFTDPLLAAGLSTLEAETAVDVMIAGFVRLALRAREGEISRDAGIDLHARACAGLIAGLLPDRPSWKIAAPD